MSVTTTITRPRRRQRAIRSGRQRLAAGVLAASAILAACSSNEPVAETDEEASQAGATSEAPEVLSADLQFGWIKNMQYGGTYQALEHGFYDAVGVEVEHLAGGPSVDAISVVASGNALVGLSNSNELAVARGQGIPVVAIGAAFQASPNAMMSLAEDPVLTLEDQYGKTVAVSDSNRPVVEGLMEREGLDPSQVNFVPKNEDPSVLADGLVDVYWGFTSSEAAVLRAQGVEIETVSLADLGVRTYANTYFTTDDAIAENREAIVRLLAADIAGWSAMVDDPEGTAQIVIDDYQTEGLEFDVVLEQALAYVELVTAGDAEVLDIDPAVFEQNIADAVESELIDESFDVGEVVNTELLDEARAMVPTA